MLLIVSFFYFYPVVIVVFSLLPLLRRSPLDSAKHRTALIL